MKPYTFCPYALTFALASTVGLMPPTAPARASDLAIKNVRLYVGPGEEPIEPATIVIRDGRISGVGKALDAGDLEVLDGAWRVATAGLWNCHVHLTDQAFNRPGAEAAKLHAGVAQTGEYAAAGGDILFGTDVGYMTDFDTADELALLARAGLELDAVLAALTTTPARRFADESGRVEIGAPGDVVIYRDDPAKEITALSRVAHTIRGGRIVFSAAD